MLCLNVNGILNVRHLHIPVQDFEWVVIFRLLQLSQLIMNYRIHIYIIIRTSQYYVKYTERTDDVQSNTPFRTGWYRDKIYYFLKLYILHVIPQLTAKV